MRPAPGTDHPAPGAAVWAALGTVYVIWSTTFLAIRVTNETIPPLLGAAARFLIAGGALYAIVIRLGEREEDRPGPRQWRSAATVGALLMFCGNGGVVWAERTVPTGIVALIIATIPLWMAVMDRLVYRHRQPRAVVFGLLLGFAGAAGLVGDSLAGDVDPAGLAFAVAATICWAAASLYSRRAPLPRRSLVGASMQMLAAGSLFLVAGAAVGEVGAWDPSRFSRASALALGYLIVFGSWIGFTSYLWLLRNARTSLVATYAYVTPVGAVALGALFLHETVTARTTVAGGLVLVAVAVIVKAGAGAQRRLDAGEQGRPLVEVEVGLQGGRGTNEQGLAERGGGELDPDGKPV